MGSQWRFCGSVPNFSTASASIRCELKMPVIAIHTDGDPHHDLGVGRGRQAEPAILRRDGGAEQAELLHLLDDLGRPAVGVVELLDPGATSRSTQRSMVASSCASSAGSILLPGRSNGSSRRVPSRCPMTEGEQGRGASGRNALGAPPPVMHHRPRERDRYQGTRHEKTPIRRRSGRAAVRRAGLRPRQRLADAHRAHRLPVHAGRLAGQDRAAARAPSSASYSASPSWSTTAPAPAARSPPTTSPSRRPTAIRCCWAISAATRWCRISTPSRPTTPSPISRRVAWIGTQPNLLGCHPDFPHDTLAQADRRGQGGARQVSSTARSGVGTSPSLTMELLKQKTGVDLTLISYRGASAAAADVLAGHLPLCIANIDSLMGQVSAGKLKPIATTGAQRSPVRARHADLRRGGLPRPRRHLVVAVGGAGRHAGQDQGEARLAHRAGPAGRPT